MFEDEEPAPFDKISKSGDGGHGGRYFAYSSYLYWSTDEKDYDVNDNWQSNDEGQ